MVPKVTELIRTNAESSSNLSHSEVPNLTYHEPFYRTITGSIIGGREKGLISSF